MKMNQPTLAIYGDSISIKYEGGGWPQKIEKHIAFKTIYNHAIGGSGISRTTPNNTLSLLDDENNLHPDADIVIMLERPKDEFGEIQKDHIDLWLRKNRGGQCNFDNAIHLIGNSNYSDFQEEIVNTIPIHA